MQLLKNGATDKVIPFLMVLASDGRTPATGLSPAVTISKNGAAPVAPGGAVGEIGNGWYKLTPSSGDTGTNGPLILHATAGTADPADVQAEVLPVDLFPANGFLGVDLQAWLGVAPSALVNGRVKIVTGLNKNVALPNFPFEMNDAVNHQPMTGLTVTATRDIDGAGMAAAANAVTESANGWYKIDWAASDLNGATIAVRMSAPGADDNDFTLLTDP